MKRSTALGIALLLLAPLASLRADDAPPPSARPNIVIILADDFGVGDIQAHYPENKIATPHLDRLVRQGRSFTDAHTSSAVCSPTRYGLLTGRYNWRTRLQEWVLATYEPPLIAEDRPTLPGSLGRQGYHTACIGKWHLGWEWPGPQRSRMTDKHNGQARLEWDFTKPIVPSKDFQGKSGIAPIADFVMETDWSTGQVIEAINNAGLAEDTLIVFTADNGHSHYTGWQQLVAAGHQPSGPYRGHKGDIWEGGHRVPLVIRWPGHVEAGTSSSQMVCLTDLFATCAAIIGEEPPASGAEDSLSFLPALLGKSDAAGRTTLISHSNFGEFAYRDGPWKLVRRLSKPNLEQSRGKPTVAELYRLDSDVGEQTDLSGEHPDVVEHMTKDLRMLIDRGTSRDGQKATNDTIVRFETTQEKRWAPALDESE